MQVVIRKITPFRSQHGGHDCFRIDGFHVDEFGELVKGYTFIDPNNDNSVQWIEVIDTQLRHRGEDIIVDGVRMKNRAKGLWSADCQPIVVDRVPRP